MERDPFDSMSMLTCRGALTLSTEYDASGAVHRRLVATALNVADRHRIHVAVLAFARRNKPARSTHACALHCVRLCTTTLYVMVPSVRGGLCRISPIDRF